VNRAAETRDGSREISYFEAILEAQREEMLRDERVFLIAEDIALYEKLGLFPGVQAGRLRSAPISESGFVGMSLGAAMTGMRPIVDLVIASLVYVAMDPLVNQAAKLRYMSGGQARLPVVFRAGMWYGSSHAAHHSDRPYPMFMNVPGIKVAVPATPADAKGLLVSAIRDDDPVILFEEKSLWPERGPVPEGDFQIPLGRAALHREGGDVTIATIGSSLRPALDSAEELAGAGVSAEVIDLRSLVPLDRGALLASVAKTRRLVVVDPAARTCGAAAEIAASVAEELFSELAAPVRRVTTLNAPR
jgi:pyruvate/2-oxoglutarate/acetoin dehydrogenase E1 component